MKKFLAKESSQQDTERACSSLPTTLADVRISHRTYSNMIKLAEIQDGRIKLLQCSLSETSQQLKVLEKEKDIILSKSKKIKKDNELLLKSNKENQSIPLCLSDYSVDDDESINWRQRCQELEQILTRQTGDDVGKRLEYDVLEKVVFDQEIALNRNQRLIKDLKYELEKKFSGTGTEKWMEMRLKNDKLEKILQRKEELLADHATQIRELESTLKNLAGTTGANSTNNDGSDLSACLLCTGLQAEIEQLKDMVLAQQLENDDLTVNIADLKQNLMRERASNSSKYQSLQYDFEETRRECQRLKNELLCRNSGEATPTSGRPVQAPPCSRSVASSYQIRGCEPCNMQFASEQQYLEHKRANKCKS